MKYSVIMPCYNSSQFVLSSISQFCSLIKARDDIELIIVDDGSSDSTIAILKNINSPNIRIIEEEHKGVSNARNSGIENAKGQYILFLDSDDYYSEQLFDVFDKINLNNQDVIFYGFRKVMSDGRRTKEYKFSDFSNKDGEYVLDMMLSKKIIFHICSMLISKEFILKEKLAFNVSLQHDEDHDFIISCLINNSKVSYISDILFNYVNNDSSVVNKPVGYSYMTKFKAFEEIIPNKFKYHSFNDINKIKYYEYFSLTIYLLMGEKIIKKGVQDALIVNIFTEHLDKLLSNKIIYPMTVTGMKTMILANFFKIISFSRIYKIVSLLKHKK